MTTSPVAVLPPDGSLNFSVELRCAINKALRETPLTRGEIAARMSALLGGEVTEAMLDAWTAPSRSRWRFPFEYAAAFDEACETTVLLELLARKRKHRVLGPAQALDAEIGRIEREMLALRDRRTQLLMAPTFEGHFS